uniref:Uncharacterized protein n=1 Tax=Castor canadensis TaxID=51338 RepID=A0A8C0X9A6_CASCN
MVSILKGMIIENSLAMKQVFLYMDESDALGRSSSYKSLITLMSLLAELVNVLQEQVGKLTNQNVFSLTQSRKKLHVDP